MAEQTPESTQTSKAAKGSHWMRWLRDIVLVLLVFAAVQWWQARNLAQDAAPPLVGHLLDGTPYQLDPGEGAALVHFWASWCPVCRLEQDSIASIAGDSRVITVATTSGSPDEVAAYLAREGVMMPVVIDEDGAIARQWGVSGVPATFVVNTDGEISHAGMGYSTELGMRLRLWLAD